MIRLNLVCSACERYSFQQGFAIFSPDVVLGLDVDCVGVQLPHGVVACAACVDVAADGVLWYRNDAKAGGKAWQGTKGTPQWMLKESLAVATAVWRALSGVYTTLAIECWIWRASKHRDRNRLGKISMQMGFYLAEVDPWNCNLGRVDDIVLHLGGVPCREPRLDVVDIG